MTGDALNINVAKIVFGLRCVYQEDGSRHQDGSVEFVTTKSGVYCYHGETIIHRLPNYAEDIAQAWTIVECMRNRGLWLTIHDQRPSRDEYLVQFGNPDSAGGGSSHDHRITWAICMAALEACGV